jgi:hypothetical protein
MRLLHKVCGNEFDAPDEVSERVRVDLNGGATTASPPLPCPVCGLASRYSEFLVVTPDA